MRKSQENEKTKHTSRDRSMVIMDEYQLHTKVVAYIRAYHKTALIAAGLGELQDTQSRRIQAWRKGYTRGQPDIMILNCSGPYIGLAIEFKSPKGTGELSYDQKVWHERLAMRGWHVLVSNDYEEIIHTICVHMSKEKWICQICQRWTRKTHKHKINTSYSTCSGSDTAGSAKHISDDPVHPDIPIAEPQDIDSGREHLLAVLSTYEFSPSAPHNDSATSAADQIRMAGATYKPA